MTLFIACLVIYGLDMNPWLYAVAFVLWVIRVTISGFVVYALGEPVAGSRFPASA